MLIANDFQPESIHKFFTAIILMKNRRNLEMEEIERQYKGKAAYKQGEKKIKDWRSRRTNARRKENNLYDEKYEDRI